MRKRRPKAPTKEKEASGGFEMSRQTQGNADYPNSQGRQRSPRNTHQSSNLGKYQEARKLQDRGTAHSTQGKGEENAGEEPCTQEQETGAVSDHLKITQEL